MITSYIDQKIKFDLSVCRVESKVWYDLGFHNHHYMSREINKASKCLLFFWNSTPVAFISLLNRTFRGCNKNDHSVSRLVVLPQYQGLGFGKRVLNATAGIIKNIGGNLYIKTLHQKLGKYLERSDKWTPTNFNGRERKAYDPKSKNVFDRKSYCFKYIGEPIEGYDEMFRPINELRKKG